MHLSTSLATLLTTLPPIHAHPTTPVLLVSTQASASTPGYCWITMYKQPNYQGQGLRIAFADHYCYDLTVSQRNFPDEYRTGVKSMDIEQQCSCRWVYAASMESEVADDGVEGVGAALEVSEGASADCEAPDGGSVYWAMGRKELTGRLQRLGCSGAPGHG